MDFQQLAARAEKQLQRKGKNRKPYVLSNLPDEQPDIVAEYPDANKQMAFEAAQTVQDQINVLFGKDAMRLRQILDGQDIQVVLDIISDMWRWWDDDSREVAGGKEG